MSTEAKLWDAIYRASPYEDGLELYRFEPSLILGVSDLEYIGKVNHGWIELKVGSIPVRASTPLQLNEPFKFEQQVWLLHHHRPKRFLHSWLLVGIPDRNQWSQFILIDPILAASMSHHSTPWSMLQRLNGCHQFTDLKRVLRFINS